MRTSGPATFGVDEGLPAVVILLGRLHVRGSAWRDSLMSFDLAWSKPRADLAVRRVVSITYCTNYCGSMSLKAYTLESIDIDA